MAEFLTWKAVVAFIGSIGAICLTTWRLVSQKKSDSNKTEALERKVAELSEETAVQESQIEDIQREQLRLHTSFEKLNDLLLRLLTEK